ncbi:MAG: hypothetical protein Hyperionvirus7_44 [Hyperionvirus sp.]|uniref:RING-type domain-containing protein n=1 Tax=Hyperionvirus sp. TaxID=2487770 RepID=A0A3G5AC82_9VIRU|nr:MAG: hypothetical protein Hyperionvirus7_44 [Hyperionvirus sp.]
MEEQGNLQLSRLDGFHCSETRLLLLCGICRRICRNPIMTNCKHIFCENCIRRRIKKICKVCSAVITDTAEAAEIKRYIDKVIVQCLEGDCEWKGLVPDYVKHELTHIQVMCPQCMDSIPLSEIAEHKHKYSKRISGGDNSNKKLLNGIFFCFSLCLFLAAVLLFGKASEV